MVIYRMCHQALFRMLIPCARPSQSNWAKEKKIVQFCSHMLAFSDSHLVILFPWGRIGWNQYISRQTSSVWKRLFVHAYPDKPYHIKPLIIFDYVTDQSKYASVVTTLVISTKIDIDRRRCFIHSKSMSIDICIICEHIYYEDDILRVATDLTDDLYSR